MKITLNGEEKEVAPGTVADLLLSIGIDLSARGTAVARNGRVVGRSRWTGGWSSCRPVWWEIFPAAGRRRRKRRPGGEKRKRRVGSTNVSTQAAIPSRSERPPSGA